MPPSYMGKSTAFALLGVLGLSSVIMWADLLGHWSGFELSSSGIQGLANARIFFLVGFTSAACISIGVRHATEKGMRFMQSVLPIAGCAGTLLYGFAYAPESAFSQTYAIVGLAVCGASYYGMATLFYIELAKTRRFTSAVWIVAASLFLKTVLGDVVGLYSSGLGQVVFTAVLPAIALGCLFVMYKAKDDTYQHAFQARPIPKKSMKELLYFFIAASIIVAALRGFSHLGLWGSGYYGSTLSSIFDYLLVGVLLLGFAYGALIRNSNEHMLTRYQPAFLVLISGFLVYTVVTQISPSVTLLSVLTDYFAASELFGHLLLRAVVFTALRTNGMSGWRLQGISDTAYGLTSIVWAILLQDAVISVQLLVIIALFFSMAAAVRPLSKNPYENERFLAQGSREEAVGCGDADAESSASDANASVASETISDHVGNFHHALAARYALSPRETDVFLLLAQGRSRPYISQSLYLSDGTVKTHVSHIYKKFRVGSRQELLTVIQESQLSWKTAEPVLSE